MKKYKPHYNRKLGCWEVYFKDPRDEWDISQCEKGSVLYVASEYTKTGLNYNFQNERGEDHEHCFDHVVMELIRRPDKFSTKGYESDYSNQELEFLKALQTKLLEK